MWCGGGLGGAGDRTSVIVVGPRYVYACVAVCVRVYYLGPSGTE